MTLHTTVKLGLVGGVMWIAACSRPVEAGHRRYDGHAGYSRASADVESLDADLYAGYEGWELHVRYKVEIEDAYHHERFDLVLDVTEYGRPVLDAHGRQLQFVIRLDHPYDVDDDEVKFRDRVVLRLLGGRIRNGRHLKLYATVVERGTGRPLDREDESVRLRYGRCRERVPYRQRGFGLRFGLHLDR